MPARLAASLILALSLGCSTDLPSDNKASTSGPPPTPSSVALPHVNPARAFQPLPEDAPDSVSRDEVLIRRLPAKPGSLNPIFFTSMYDNWMEELLFDTLFNFDRELKWTPNWAMVETFEDSDDRKVSRVKLRPGLKWHDGARFTAHDVRFSWQVILDPEVPATAVRSGTDQIVDVRVIDDLNLEYHHKEARPTNTWNMLFPIIPKHIFDNPEERRKDPTMKQSDFFNRFNRTEVVGNGPYRLVEWVAEDHIIVDRWDDYHGDRPAFKRIILKILKDSGTALQLFNKGEIDEMELTQLQFAMHTDDEAFTKHGHKILAPEWTYSFIGWNADGSNPFFGDPKVRRALSHAVNFEKIRKVVLHDLATRSHGIYAPDSWMGAEVELIDYDLDQAQKLLDEAGWKKGSDGWRIKTIEGEAVPFEYEMLIPKESENSPKIADILYQDLTRIGVRMKQRPIEFVTFLSRVRNHNFQSSIMAMGTGTDPDTGRNLWHSSMYQGGRNYHGYKNERVDELYELGRREFDPEKRAGYYREIQRIIYEDQPITFLFNRSTTWAIHKRIRGIQWSPRGLFGFDPGCQSWWVHKNDSLRK